MTKALLEDVEAVSLELKKLLADLAKLSLSHEVLRAQQSSAAARLAGEIDFLGKQMHRVSNYCIVLHEKLMQLIEGSAEDEFE